MVARCEKGRCAAAWLGGRAVAVLAGGGRHGACWTGVLGAVYQRSGKHATGQPGGNLSDSALLVKGRHDGR